jgi:DNA-binding transcriptional ArsR family regulator
MSQLHFSRPLGAEMSVDKIFEALSSAPRWRILAFLSKTDMTAGEIAQRFASMMSQPAISKHLSVLENAGLVWREKRGPNVHYGLKYRASPAPPKIRIDTS